MRHAITPQILLLATTLLCACSSSSVPWPDNGPCDGTLPMRGDGTVRRVTFPERDFVCRASSERGCEAVVPLRGDSERTVDVVNELGGATVAYVLDQLAIPSPRMNRLGELETVGYDLDGWDHGPGVGTTCATWNADYVSAYEPGVAGVDNAFASFVSVLEGVLERDTCPDGVAIGCVDALLRRDVHEGVLLLVLELTGVDSLEHDPEVEAALYVVRVPGGGPPSLTGPRGATTTRLESHQRFTTERVLVEPTRADILHRRLRVRWPVLALPRERFGYPTPLHDVELRASVCANGLFRGHFGGRATVDDLAAQAGEAFPPGAEDTIQSVLEAIADLDPSRDGGACTAVSTAYAIEGVPAERAP